MIEDESTITAARQAADAGHAPHRILRLIMEQVRTARPEYPSIVAIEACVCRAFGIPLRDARDIVERWIGVTDEGDWNDADIDQQLGPWIERYRE